MIVRHILLALLAIQVTTTTLQVDCTSSYIDDYFLPTAKLALNKIQQSFSPPQTSSQQTGPTSSNKTNEDAKPVELPNEQVASQRPMDFVVDNPADKVAEQEPSRQEQQESSVVYYKPAQVDRQEEPVTLTVSSTESVSTDPTSTSQLATDDDDQDDKNTQEKTSPTTTTTTTTTTAQTTTTDKIEQPQTTTEAEQAQLATQASNSINDDLVVVAKSADDSTYRENEMEAIAAVDESIAFGDLMVSRDSIDTCYDEYGNARFCEPEFENVAFERPVEVSSECGSPATRFCTTTYASMNERNDQIRNCHICDSQHAKKRHPAAYLTDINNSNNPTCWVSAPIGLRPASNQSEAPQRDNVTLTLSLGKSYEITYISLQFCSLKPDSLAIYKSNSNGLLWSPYQFYSSQCKQMYGMETTTSRGSQLEAVCVNSSSSGAPSAVSTNNNSGRIAFSTLEANKQTGMSETADEAKLSDWTSATDIRIVLDRHQASWIQSSLAVHAHHSHLAPSNAANLTTSKSTGPPVASLAPTANKLTASEEQQENLNQLTNPSDTYNYALSDLTVGGRCKCNGHAQRCVHSEDGQLRCDCRHNTAGRDCERCAPFHFDRPWQPATQMDANPCQPCQCNGHSRRCRFDPALYASSGRRSGGVCIACRDNTAGRHCNYCREGYTRDHSRPMSDKEACKPCNCHPVGSSGRVCNQTSGQCPCKEGVTGLECTRCAPGYQQSSSPSEPCIKLPENDINSYEPVIELTDQDEANIQSINNHEQDVQPAATTAPTRTTNEASGGRYKSPPFKAGPADEFSSPDLSESPNAMDETDQQFGPMRSHRNQAPRYQQPNNQQWTGAARRPPPPAARHDYYYGKQFRPRYSQEFSSADQDSDQLDEYSDYRQPTGYFSRRPSAAKKAARPVVDVNSVDESAAPGEASMASYAPINPLLLDNPNEPMDEQSFNQIQTASNSNNKRPPFGRPLKRLNPYNVQGGRQPVYLAPGGGRRFQDTFEPLHQQFQKPNSITCAGCQSATRKFSRKQFCHLDYAIKALVLDVDPADDWTRYVVQIQDIFKSAQQRAVNDNSKSLEDNLLQSDDPNVSLAPAMATGKALASNETQVGDNNSGEQPAAESQHASHRMKIGSVQTIWVPTEDVSCKCPRLKKHSTYLLLGLVDKSEHSMASIQLDRHGVALEWKPSLQERLIKYQRRQSRKGC